MSWSWETYRLDLLSRIEQAPPLMRSVWEPRANRLDWLAPAFFPLPMRIVPPRRSDAPNNLKDMPEPASTTKQHSQERIFHGIPLIQTYVEVRAGLPASIFRSSLIASLLKHTPAQQQRFFGIAFTDVERPTVGYINIHEVPLWKSDLPPDDFLFIPTILERSLPYLDARNARPQDVPKAAERAASSRAEALAFPDVVVLDETGWHGGSLLARFEYFLNFVTLSAIHRIIDQITVIIITDMLPSIQNKHPLVCVDAPSSPEEYRTFLLAWERWRAARDSPRVLEARANFRLESVRNALIRLGMTLPHTRDTDVDTVPPSGNGAEPDIRNLATFGIVCSIVAMQRDSQDPQDIEELCRHLRNRLDSQTVSDIERVMRSYLMARGFLEPKYSLLRDDSHGTTLAQVTQRYVLIGGKFLDFIASNQTKPITPPEIAQSVLFDQRTLYARGVELLNLLHDSPLLPNMFTLETMPDTNVDMLRLTAERLGIAFLAHEAVLAMERSDCRSSQNILFSYAGCLPLGAWGQLIDSVFAHLCERGLANLAHGAALNDLVLLCLSYADSGLFQGSKAARERISDNMFMLFGIKIDPQSLHNDAVQQDSELWMRAVSAPYIDAVVHASLRYNLRIHGTPPNAWKWWVGHGEDWQAYDFVHPLDDAVVAEHVSYLHELLHAPIPACDNAELLLRFIDEL